MSVDHAASALTFLFTDLEGSTRLWEAVPLVMPRVLAQHDALARDVVHRHGGRVVKMAGDGVHAVFDRPAPAVNAALEFQRKLAALAAAGGVDLRARCGIHTGTAEHRDADYFGGTINRAARIMAAAHGGQVLLSQACVDALDGTLQAGATLRDLGMARLRDLARPERLHQLVHDDLRRDFPPLSSLDAAPNNLPLQLTSFIGRETEAAAIRAELRDVRLLALTGTGGIGKTRLALQLAAETVGAYADGAWFVDLAPVADPTRVPAAVAKALRVREDPDAPLAATLGAYLAPRRLLLILDNCEHLLGACADLTVHLLAVAPHLVVLATTREPLRVPGERIWPLAPLPLPAREDPSPAQAPAVRLFLERARDVRRDFAPTSGEIDVIVDLCRRVDGIPLAIELAAARVRALSVADIGRRLSDRFALLGGGHRTALPRQRTLAALIGWSYDLLDDHERRLFVELSVFAGGFDLDAVEKICGRNRTALPILDAVVALVDKSLVVADERDGVARYRLLDSLGAFGRARLGAEAFDLNDRHLAYFLDLARAAHEALRGPEQTRWLDRLTLDLDNIRAAMAWSLDAPGHAVDALELSGKLWRYWHLTGMLGEGRGYLATALLRAGDDPALAARADALYAAGALAKNQGDLDDAARWLEEAGLAYRHQGRTRDTAAALGSLGNVRQDQGDLPAARALQNEAYTLFRAVGDAAAEATALLNLGSICADLGAIEESNDHYRRSLVLAHAHGLRTVECMVETNLGELALLREDLAAARVHFARARELGRDIRFRIGAASAATMLAGVAMRTGLVGEAQSMLVEALVALLAAGAKGPLIVALETAAEFCARTGKPDDATTLLDAAKYARTTHALPVLPLVGAQHRRIEALATPQSIPAAGTPAGLAAAAAAALETIRAVAGTVRPGGLPDAPVAR